MWSVSQALMHIWTWISTRLFKKNAQTDIEKVAGSGEDLRITMQATQGWARNQYEERQVAIFRNDLQSLYQREVAMLQRNTPHSSRKYYGLRRGTVGPIENDPYRVAPPPRPKHAKQLRKHSAKYRLRQGDYVDNWDCTELSELYGKRSPPQPSTPSPLLSGFSPLVGGEDTREETHRFSGRWPTLPCTATVTTSRILRSPFLASSEPKQSPFLAQFTDLTQTIMTDFKPVGYSTNALSAVTDTFWDAPAVMPAKPARVLQVGASNNQSDANDTLAPSYSMGHIWSLPSCPNPDIIYEARGVDELC